MAKKEREGEDTVESAAETSIRLERLARLLRQAAHANGLVPTQWEALRYLARASRHSRSPGSLARYLGATKGTISQSLLTLEKKGLIARTNRAKDQRYADLSLTAAGQALLGDDPLQELAADIDDLGFKTRRRLARGLSALLAKAVSRQGAASFGTCADCRYFREGGPGNPANCMLDGEPLAVSELHLLCGAHVER